MALYIIKCNGEVLANDELYQKAIVGGERKFVKGLFSGEITGKSLFDNMLFPLTDKTYKELLKSYAPQIQDFDAQYKKFNVLREEDIQNASFMSETYPGTSIIKASPELTKKLFTFNRISFFSLRDFSPARGYKYNMLPGLAKIKVCKYWYIALNAVNVSSDKPIVITR